MNSIHSIIPLSRPLPILSSTQVHPDIPFPNLLIFLEVAEYLKLEKFATMSVHDILALKGVNHSITDFADSVNFRRVSRATRDITSPSVTRDIAMSIMIKSGWLNGRDAADRSIRAASRRLLGACGFLQADIITDYTWDATEYRDIRIRESFPFFLIQIAYPYVIQQILRQGLERFLRFASYRDAYKDAYKQNRSSHGFRYDDLLPCSEFSQNMFLVNGYHVSRGPSKRYDCDFIKARVEEGISLNVSDAIMEFFTAQPEGWIRPTYRNCFYPFIRCLPEFSSLEVSEVVGFIKYLISRNAIAGVNTIFQLRFGGINPRKEISYRPCGMTALQMAICSASQGLEFSCEMVKLLLTCGADPTIWKALTRTIYFEMSDQRCEFPDGMGSALHVAVIRKFPVEIMEQLVAAGADRRARWNGLTPGHLDKTNQYPILHEWPAELLPASISLPPILQKCVIRAISSADMSLKLSSLGLAAARDSTISLLAAARDSAISQLAAARDFAIDCVDYTDFGPPVPNDRLRPRVDHVGEVFGEPKAPVFRDGKIYFPGR